MTMKKIFAMIFLACAVLVSGCTKNFYLDQEFYQTNGEFVNITSEEFANLDSQNYALFVYNNYCAFSIPCDEIFHQYMTENHINFLSMSYEEFKKTNLHKTVDFAPSVILVKNWKIVAYLDTEKDAHLDLYQDVEKFGEWFEKYVNLVEFDEEDVAVEPDSTEESENQYYMDKEYSDVDTPEHRITTCEETAGFFLNFNEWTFIREDESEAWASYARNGHVNYLKRWETAQRDIFCFIDMVDNSVMIEFLD